MSSSFVMICEGCLNREAVVWFDYKVGKHSGPGEVFIIPDMGDIKNQTQCKCHDRSINISITVRAMCHETNLFLRDFKFKAALKPHVNIVPCSESWRIFPTYSEVTTLEKGPMAEKESQNRNSDVAFGTALGICIDFHRSKESSARAVGSTRLLSSKDILFRI
jgi:hypothetical protein